MDQNPTSTATASSAAPNKQATRIQRYLQDLQRTPLPFIRNLELTVNDEGHNQLNGELLGPPNTPYENGHFSFKIRFPSEYPYKSPEFIFTTNICHPNIHRSAGTACSDALLAAWTPQVTLTAIFEAMYSLLKQPNYEVPIDGDGFEVKNEDKAREWTQEFASAVAPRGQAARIQHDMQALETNPLPFIQNLQTTVNAKGLNQLKGALLGPPNTPYENGHFRFEIRFPSDYPFRPLEFIFLTAICHPNIDIRTGTACHDVLLNNWAPTIRLTAIFQAMYSLLEHPNYEVPIDGDTVESKNPVIARQWTHNFAQPPH